MTNKTIKMMLFENGIKQWELAAELGISEPTLTKRLRNELTGEELQKILEAIDAIVRRKEGKKND